MTAGPTKDFDILLASNASLDTFPGNKPGLFRNKLSETLKLDEHEWEVALSEIFYPNNYQNPVPAEFAVNIIISTPGRSPEKHTREVRVQRRNEYMDLQTFISEFNMEVNKIETELVTMDKDIARFSINDGKYISLISEWSEGVEIEILNQRTKDYLSYIGFGDMKYKEGKPADSRVKLEMARKVREGWQRDGGRRERRIPFGIAEHPALFIYCDKLEYQLVGDTRAPLLATLPVHASYDRPIVFEAPMRLSYAPLKKGYISDIEITIMDDSGKQINFKEGKIFLKLHFRKSKFTN